MTMESVEVVVVELLCRATRPDLGDSRLPPRSADCEVWCEFGKRAQSHEDGCTVTNALLSMLVHGSAHIKEHASTQDCRMTVSNDTKGQK